MTERRSHQVMYMETQRSAEVNELNVNYKKNIGKVRFYKAGILHILKIIFVSTYYTAVGQSFRKFVLAKS